MWKCDLCMGAKQTPKKNDTVNRRTYLWKQESLTEFLKYTTASWGWRLFISGMFKNTNTTSNARQNRISLPPPFHQSHVPTNPTLTLMTREVINKKADQLCSQTDGAFNGSETGSSLSLIYHQIIEKNASLDLMHIIFYWKLQLSWDISMLS